MPDGAAVRNRHSFQQRSDGRAGPTGVKRLHAARFSFNWANLLSTPPTFPETHTQLCSADNLPCVRRRASVSKEDSPTGGGTPGALGPVGSIARNLSLIAAVAIYLGWAWDSAFYGYFNLGPIQLGTSPFAYMLSSLHVFRPVTFVTAVVAIVGITLWTRSSDLLSGARTLTGEIARILRTSSCLRSLNMWLGRLNQVIPPAIKKKLPDMKYWWKPKGMQAGLGSAITVTALILYKVTERMAVSTNLTYLVIALMALGPLLLTSAFRSDPRGRVPYSLAVVVSIVCGVWAASTYASGLGTSAAQAFAAHLPTETGATVCSVRSRNLSGPEVTAEKLAARSTYPYCYKGLRLLHMDGSTYYLLPEGWTLEQPHIYIIRANDQTSVELSKLG